MSDAGKQAGRGRTAGLLLAIGVLGTLVLGSAWVLRELRSTPTGTAGHAAGGGGGGGSSAAVSLGEELRSVQTVLEAARSYLRNMKPGSAEAVLSAAVEKWPTDQQVRLLYAETLLELGRKPESYAEYSRAIGLGAEHAELRHAAGTLAADLGLRDDAEAHYLVAQKLDPVSPKYPLYLGQVQRDLGKTDAARASLMMAARLDPSMAMAWGTLAAMALDENRPDAAAEYIEKARAVEPQRVEWRLVEAASLRRRGKPVEALALFESLTPEAQARDARVVNEIGLSLGLLGRVGEAAALYVRAAEASPDSPDLLYEAGTWLEKDGQRERARRYIDEAARRGHEGARRVMATWAE